MPRGVPKKKEAKKEVLDDAPSDLGAKKTGQEKVVNIGGQDVVMLPKKNIDYGVKV